MIAISNININEICIALDIAIIAIAIPLSLDVTSRIGAKFSSNFLLTLFQKEYPEKKLIRTRILDISIIITLISFIFKVVEFEPLFLKSNIFIANSANIFVLLSTAFLVINFMIWVAKFRRYSGDITLIVKDLKRKEEKNNDAAHSYSLLAINEIALYAVRNNNHHVINDLEEYYHRKLHTSTHYLTKDNNFPQSIYKLVLDLTEEGIAKSKHNIKLDGLTYDAVSGFMLFSEKFSPNDIGKDTYLYQWYSICRTYPFFYVIKEFWRRSFDLYNYGTQRFSDNSKLTFIYFHYSLASLLLYSKEYRTLEYVLNYSQSSPPRFVLFPENNTDWFNEINRILDRNNIDNFYLFQFPETDNLGTMHEKFLWISSFFVILLAKQFSRVEHMTYQNFKAPPQLPTTNLELYRSKDTLADLHKGFNNLCQLEQEELKKLDFNTETRRDIENYLEEIGEEINKKIEANIKNQNLSEAYIYRLQRRINELVQEVKCKKYGYYFYQESSDSPSDSKKFLFSSIKSGVPRQYLINNEIPLANYDDVFITSQRYTIETAISGALIASRTERNVISEEDLERAFRRLTAKKQNYTCILVNTQEHLNNIVESFDFNGKRFRLHHNNYQLRNRGLTSSFS